MAPRWRSALDASSARDAAMLAEVLRTLQGHLQEEAPVHEPTSAEVEDLVSHAVAELQRLNGPAPVGGIAPVLGTGVLQELLRQRRHPSPLPGDVPSKVDARR